MAGPWDVVSEAPMTSGAGGEWDVVAEKPLKRQVGAGEAFGRGLGSTFAEQGNVLGLAASAPAVIFDKIRSAISGETITSAQDAVFPVAADPAKAAVDSYAINPNTEDMGGGATAANVGGRVAAMIPSMIASGGVGAAPVAVRGTVPLARAAVSAGHPLEAAKIVAQTAAPHMARGAVAAQPSFAVPATVNRAQQLTEDGADGETVLGASVANHIWNTALGAAPVAIPGGIAKRVLSGGAINAAGGAAQRATEGAILGDENAALAQPAFGPMEMGLDAGIGAVIAAALGRRPVPARVRQPELGSEERPMHGEVMDPEVPPPGTAVAPPYRQQGGRIIPGEATQVNDRALPPPADFVVGKGGPAMTQGQAGDVFAPRTADQTPQFIYDARAQSVGAREPIDNPDAGAASPDPMSPGAILAGAIRRPDEKSVLERINEAAGVRRAPTQKERAARAADVKAAVDEPVGVTRNPDQTERPLRASEAMERQAQSGQARAQNENVVASKVSEGVESTTSAPAREAQSASLTTGQTQGLESPGAVPAPMTPTSQTKAASTDVRKVRHPMRGEIEVRGSGTAIYWRDPTFTTGPFGDRFVLASPEFRKGIEEAEVKANETNAPNQEVRAPAEPQPAAGAGERAPGDAGGEGRAPEQPARGDRPSGGREEESAAPARQVDEGGDASQREAQAQEKVGGRDAPSRPADENPDRQVSNAKPADEAAARGRDQPRAVGEGASGEVRNTGTSGDVGGVEGRAGDVRTHAEILRDMQAVRDRKPRPLNKMYGAKGPTPEQLAEHGAKMRAWNAEMRKASKGEKEALERENAAFRARKAAGETDHLAEAEAKTEAERKADAMKSGADDVGTLYANPFGKVLGWAVGDTSAWAKSLSSLIDSVKKLRQKDHPDAGRQVKENWFRAIFASSSADMRAKVAQVKSDTARWVVDQFHMEAGSGRATGETFESAQHAWVNKNLVKLDPALRGLSEAELRQVVNQVTSGKLAPVGSKLGTAARVIQTTLADALKHMKDSGVDVGEIKGGYFPREFDKRLVMQRPKKEFVDALSHEYQRQGMSAADAADAADALYKKEVFGDQSSLFTGGKGSGPAPFLKGRVFGKDVDAPSHPLNKFLVRDPMVSLPKYLMAAAKRAEIAKRFGDGFERWDDLVTKIENEGGGHVISHLKDYVSMAAGLQGSGMSARAQRASSFLRTWGTFMFLEKATLSSLTEFIVPAIRSGNAMDVGRSLSLTIMDIVGKTKGAAERRAFAEDLGLIAGHLSDSMMAERWAMGDPVSGLESKLLTQYFRRTGLTQWTDATQVAAANLSQVFMRRVAKDFSAGGKLTKRHLADLGIPEAKQAEFVKFVLSKNGGMPGSADLTGPMGDLYASAVRNFTRQSIMSPSATLRPSYMHSPIGKVIGQLQSFNYAFYENVIKRVGRMSAEAVTGKDYTLAERAQLITPMAMIPMLWSAAYVLGEGRDALLGDPARRNEETTGHKVIKAIGRGAPIAPIEPLVNYATSARYRTDAVKFFAGPVIGTLSTGVDATRDVFMANSENTNTAERKAATAVYNMLIEPTVNLALGLTPLSPVSAAATQAVGSGTMREKFVGGLAGEKKVKSGSGRDAGRDSGRNSGRDSGR